ncbi:MULTISPECIES: Abi family protein [Phocaeicola]|uniref:Abi family protein n=1 Tax=Phocaeicola TaxID=909656 RepID=UPI00216B12F8
MENWLHAISNLRNCCVHYSRVWICRFMVSVTLPYSTLYPFMDNRTNLYKQIVCSTFLRCVYS